MKTFTPEEEKKIRAIWTDLRGQKRLSEIYLEHLGDFFTVNKEKYRDAEWMKLVAMVREWTREEKDEEREKNITAEMTSLEGADFDFFDDVQEKNRRRMILVLRNLITEYEEINDRNPLQKRFAVEQIRRMYTSIQQLEERMKMTDIAKNKFKLEAVRTLLPYQRLPFEEIVELKQKMNESFDRIIKLKTGERPVELAGPNALIGG